MGGTIMLEKFKWGIKSGAAVIAFLVSDMLFTEIYAFFLMNLNMEEHLLRLYFPIGSSLITLLLAFPVFMLVMRGWGELQKFHIMGKSHLPIRKYLIYAILVLIPMALLWGMQLFMIWQGKISPEDISSFTSENMITVILFNCFLFPVMEEIMFRGVLLHRLLPLGTGFSVLMTTCFFVIYHYNNPINMLLSFVMGLVFAHMVIKANGILPAIIFHIGINVLGQIVIPVIMLN